MKTVIALAFLALSLTAAAATSWQKLAEDLGGENPGAQKKAAQALTQYPGLETKLLAALDGEERPLALLVIRSLRLTKFSSRLLELARQDPDDWTVLAALNEVATDEHSEARLRFYRELLAKKEVEPAARLAALDGLSKAQLSPPLLEALFDDAYELKLAATDVAGNRWLEGQSEFAPLLERALASNPYQIRLTALRALTRAQPKLREPFRKILIKLRGDGFLPVRALAQQLYGEGK